LVVESLRRAAIGVVAGSAADLAFEEMVVALAARVACFLFVPGMRTSCEHKPDHEPSSRLDEPNLGQ
jgi:phage replication-related protein YjqB (UPF0714/DUF867 family)